MIRNTFEEDDAEDGDLEQALTDNEFPHVLSDQTFSLGVRLPL